MGDHRIERALERYGLSLTPLDLGAIARLAAPCNRISKRENGSSVHAVAFGGKMLVVAIRQHDIGPVISTFLPLDSLTAGSHRRWLKSHKAKRGGKPL